MVDTWLVVVKGSEKMIRASWERRVSNRWTIGDFDTDAGVEGSPGVRKVSIISVTVTVSIFTYMIP